MRSGLEGKKGLLLERLPEGRQRVVIERIKPEVDAGEFPIKRTIGESIDVQAVIFADGHDVISALLQYRHADDEEWTEVPLEALPEDKWRASFMVQKLGHYFYSFEAWVNPFATWLRDLEKKYKAGVELGIDFLAGSVLLETTSSRAKGRDAEELRAMAGNLGPKSSMSGPAKYALAQTPRLKDLMRAYGERHFSTRYPKELKVWVEPELARFSAWYEIFPRSCSPEPGKHGTFRDCEALLPKIADMGFDILYFPPIHPIGDAYRKGRNNKLVAEPGEPGSPWAIGGKTGGHKAILPELGTLEDFKRLVQKARDLKIEVALDIAFQCSPDHPWVKEHPEWFRKRPDGSIQYAENPPKKYQDIYPLNFEAEDWQGLWKELKSVFEFWVEQGVTVFRVDNPHTKSLFFWEWCIHELKARRPDLIFLSEAFTRRPVMYFLAKAGFTQSYNYFPWRNTKRELTEYLTELTQTELKEYFRPSLWPNTPDILTQYLQYGGRPAFMARLVLAGTLGASYGIYGPAFEYCENVPREFGSEEYLNSEKYEIRRWDLNPPGNLRELVKRVNQIRRQHPALHSNDSLRFHQSDNENLIVYSKHTPDFEDIVLMVVNLDPHHVQSGWVTLPLEQWGITPSDNFQIHDLLTGSRFLWSGPRNYVELSPQFIPAHVFHVRRFVRREHDFDYFM